MDRRPIIARRIIDRLQEFLYPMDDGEQAKVAEVIIDELSFRRDHITSRGGFIGATEDQDCVQAFLEMYPDLRPRMQEALLQIRGLFPDAPIQVEFFVDPEAGFRGTSENRGIHVNVLLDGSYEETRGAFRPLREWLQVQDQDRRLIVRRGLRRSSETPRLQAALRWLNVRVGYLIHTVGLGRDLAERLSHGDPSEEETLDICTRLGISYEWVTDPSPTPPSAYECWDEFRTRKVE